MIPIICSKSRSYFEIDLEVYNLPVDNRYHFRNALIQGQLPLTSLMTNTVSICIRVKMAKIDLF